MRRTLSLILGLGIAGIIGISPVVKAEDLMENIPREEVQVQKYEEPLEATFSPPSFYVPQPPIELPPPLYVKAGKISSGDLPSIEKIKPYLVIMVGNDLIELYENQKKKFHFIYCAKSPYREENPKRKFENTLEENFKEKPSFYALQREDGRFQNYRIGKEDSNCDISRREDATANR